GGFENWRNSGKEIDTVKSIPATEFKAIKDAEDVPVFDVRKPGEYLSEHVIDANHTSLSEINDHLAEYPENTDFYVHCAGGYRSMIAASILKSRGIHNLVDVQGGFKAIKEAGVKTSDYVCPSTL
ncbi:MAG: rhodanese-like domain-containing protein, partial [Christiangramia sp.]